jgi:hypothetical protein
MSRLVIYGEYPPLPGPAAEATLASVRAGLAGGADVVVISPHPSAAHHHADLATVAGAALLARLAPGADLEIALDPAVLADRGGRGAPAQALLAAAVAGARHSTIHLGPLGGPTGRGRVRLVLGRADRVVAASAPDTDALERAGIDRSRLSVRATEPAGAAALAMAGGGPAVPGVDAGSNGEAHREPWELSDVPGREELEAAVRRRAAGDREEAAGNSAASTWPLHVLVPFTPPTPDSGKPLFTAVKTVVWKLIAWAVLPLAEHVNHLHQATIESVDRHAALADHAGDRRVKISS